MATIKDIARACNVSTATVSYVINGKNTLLPETRERVMQTMREMNYHPSAVARGLASKRMNTLGILFDNVGPSIAVTHPYTSGILQGVVSAAAEAGHNVTLFTELWRSAAESLPALRDQSTDGIIIVAPPTDVDILPALASANLKSVTISSDSGPFGIPCVDVDNAAGVRLAFQHLRALGHRRIAYLSGQATMWSVAVRLGAFQAALCESGLSVPAAYFATCSYDDADAAYAHTQRLLSRPDPPTAFLAGNDQIALVILAAARDFGVSVPQRLSVIGFDDIPDAATARPALTTVRQPLADIGAAAARRLLRMLSGEPVPADCLLLEPLLIVRGTTAPPETNPLSAAGVRNVTD